MTSPHLEDLPPPPPGRTGWPWTEACPPLPAARPDGRPWPRISIVTPSFNQGDYIEETIRSILLQGYPDLEYIVMDGGSSDRSVEVVRKYERWITAWRSAPDKGQADAINQGLAQATGEVFHFINSDDVLAPGALAAVGAAAGDDVCVAGAVLEFGGEAPHLVRNLNLSARRMVSAYGRTPYCTWHQPGLWMSRKNLVELGGFDVDFWFCFDFHATVRYLERWPQVRYVDDVLVRFRIHPSAKTTASAERVLREHLATLDDLAGRLRTDEARAGARLGRRRMVWPVQVQAIRDSASSPLAKAMKLTRHVLLQPRVSANRFTVGAIRRELSQAFAPASRRGA